MRDIFQEITDRIAAQLDQGVRPWAKPWNASAAALDLPQNYDGRAYRGANVFWLWLAGESRGYTSPVWLTFNKAAELAKKNGVERGGGVRKGEKGTPVFFWRFPTPAENKQREERGEKPRGPMVKVYTVFNVAQCDGLPEKPAPEPRTEPERIAAAESLLAATGADIRHGGSKAFYVPSQDFVQLPPRAAFMDSDGYYSTAFHEVGHWTGHESRLNRQFGARFGDDAYAFEELVAELTAAFVCGSQGFASVERPDHAAYLAHWGRVLKKDPKAFITAASAAQKAADLILGTTFAAKAEDEPEAVAA